jgi:hypothetical protein
MRAVAYLGLVLLSMPGAADRQAMPQDATTAMIRAFDGHDIVMFGEIHGDKQEYEWLCRLVETPEFADRVDDIVVEFGNSLYQRSVDHYIAGEDVPLEQVQKAWRNTVGSVGPPSPVYGWFYKAVRDSNMRRRGKHQMRLVLGDPYGDWEKIENAAGLGPYLGNREQWYAQVVKDAVISKHHRALLIMCAGHFRRRPEPGLVEREIRAAGADPYLLVLGTNAMGDYDNLDKRFDAWPVPVIVKLAGNWVGNLPAVPVLTGGIGPTTSLKLADVADAMLYVGARNALTEVRMPRSELDGTPYGKEMARRIMIQMGRPANYLFDQAEAPQFERPQSTVLLMRPPLNSATPPNPPSSIHDPLPPRPPSQ